MNEDLPYAGSIFPTRWERLIHKIKSVFRLIRGHNKQQVISLTPEQLREATTRQYGKGPCDVCGLPLGSGFGQFAKYHKYCRAFRNNRNGFDITKVDI